MIRGSVVPVLVFSLVLVPHPTGRSRPATDVHRVFVYRNPEDAWRK
jgi:hypothetical protein